MIIDFHTHCFPDSVAEKALHSLSAAAGLTPVSQDFTSAGLTAFAKSCGVDYSVALSIATKPSQNFSVNKFAVSLKQMAGIISFGSVYPGADDAIESLRTISAAGLAGIKLHPEYQSFYVDDEKNAYPVYEFCEEHDLVVVFHAGVDLGIEPPVRSTPDRIARVARAFPKLKIVAAHLGGYFCWDMAKHFLVGSEVFLDTAYISRDLPTERAFDIIKSHGPEKVLMGSDFPWESPADTIAYIKSLPLTLSEHEMILGQNAAKLLGL